jgi:hypothetical protein
MTLVPDPQSHLLSIILAVHTATTGDQLAFRYPPVERKHLSEETQEQLRKINMRTDFASKLKGNDFEK